MDRPLRWGILSTGNIARQFAQSLGSATRSRLVAAGSRRIDAARRFAAEFQLPAAGSYDQVLADPDVEAVYNALPNSLHHHWTIRALEAGKHVLCEKPFASNTAQSQQMFDVARARGLILVEAFMYRCHPLTATVLERVRQGAIGKLQLIRTSFCYATRRIDQNIRYRADLAGGALMDVGCYCISYARLLAGSEPDAVNAVARLHPNGVDQVAAGTLRFADGLLASFTCGMSVQTDNSALISGTDGYIQVTMPWKPPERGAQYVLATMEPPRQDRQVGQAGPHASRKVFSIDAGKALYALEADHFAAVVQDAQAPAVSPSDTLGNMRVLDALRRQVGLSY